MSEDKQVFGNTSVSTGLSSDSVQNLKTNWADPRSVKQAGYWDYFECKGTIQPMVRDALINTSRNILSGHILSQNGEEEDSEEEVENGEDEDSEDPEITVPVFNTTTTSYPISNSPHYLENRERSDFCAFIGLPELVSQSGKQVNVVQKGHPGQKQAKPKGNQKSGKKDLIREQISLKKSKKEDDKLAEFMKGNNALDVPIRSKDESIQVDLTRLIAHINAIIQDHVKGKSKVNEEKKIDLYFGLDKIVTAIPNLEVRNHLDNTVNVLGEDQSVEDLRTIYNKFRATIFPDPTVPVLRAADLYPKFFQYTSYDNFLPSTMIKLFDSQLAMLQLIAQQLTSASMATSSGLLTILNTVPGQGKTTLVLAIAKMIQASPHCKVMYKPDVGRKGRNRGEAKKKVGGRTLKCLYVTPQTLLPVAKQVGSLLHENTPFGIAYTEGDSYGVSDNYNCYCGKNRVTYVPPVMILSSPSTAIRILKHNQEQKSLKASRTECNEYEAHTDYIVFYDEPTATGMDQALEDNPVVQEFAEFLKVMPKWTILSCATLKNLSQYPELCDIFRSKYPNAVLETVNNSKIPIGASVMNFSGSVMLPHQKCTTYAELERVISKLIDEMILQKFYTHRIVHSMYLHLIALGVDIPTEIHYANYVGCHEISQDSIQFLAIEYLRLVLNASIDNESLISRFCSQNIDLVNFDPTNILSNVTKLNSQTLVVGQDPLQHFKIATDAHYKSILKHFNNARNFRSIESDYKHKISAWEQAYIAKEASEAKRKAGGGKKFDVDSLGSVDSRMQEWKNDNPCPKLSLPINLGIRSQTQTKEKMRDMIDYCSKDYDLINPRSGDDLIDDMLKVMLAAGVGVYCKQLDESYLRVVTEQMEKGNMSIVFCDDSICYGVNYPIENIVILDTPLMMNRSVNTLLQLISRAGRKGRSDRANVWVAEPVLAKLSNYINDPDFDDIEFKNIRLACQMAQIEDA